MTYRLTFTINREVYSIIVKNKEVYYSDRKLGKATRIIPADERIKLKVSRNIVPKFIAEQFELNEEEKKEYESCKSEEDIVKVCIRDCLKNGSQLLKQEKIEYGI